MDERRWRVNKREGGRRKEEERFQKG